MTGLRVGDTEVAEYVEEPDLDIRLAPRPYLHPVRTLAGTVVTDTLCYDHPWHMGASLTIADVAGVNLWGGRTFVRDEGYVWLDDHGRVRHLASKPVDGGFLEQLLWCDATDRLLLREERVVTAAAAPRGWELRFSYELSAPGPDDVVLGSPVTHGRPAGAGYGGFFWRATPGAARAFSPSGADPHGSTDPWVALVVEETYTLVFRGLSGADRWFVRTGPGEYTGVCAALAWSSPLPIHPGIPLTREIRVLVADGVLSRKDVGEALLD
jgi:hypothetical protein